MKLTESGDEAFFYYDWLNDRNSSLSDSLYDFIVFDNSNEKAYEHNFQQFLSDSLQTILNYQENIENLNHPIKNKTHYLLYLSFYF